MTKRKSRKQSTNPEQQAQRELLDALRQELADLHEISLAVMSDLGILPPMYGGEHLEDDREVIPLWGVNDNDEPELGALLLRVVPGMEPNPDLDALRDDLELTNDWQIAELLDTLVTPEGRSLVEGADEIEKLSMLFVLLDSQISPAPGYDRQTMIEFVADMRPFAVFPIVPTAGEDDSLTYRWGDLEEFRAEVVYAETPQLLEAAVWEYLLNLALNDAKQAIQAEGRNPGDELIATDAAGLSAVFEMIVLRGLRLYGATTPVRARQRELDILREENDDLIVKAPLKPEIEPIPMLAVDRREIEGDADGTILHLQGSDSALQRLWPQIRANKYFCIRLRYGVFRRGRRGQLQVSGYSTEPTMEWFIAETLPDLYRQVRLAVIYEMLAATHMVQSKIGGLESFAS